MVSDDRVISYIDKLHDTGSFDQLEKKEKESIIFTAQELLKDYFEESRLDERIVALQVLYMLESDNEEFASLKKHGVSSYSVKGVSVSFDEGSSGFIGLISPIVVQLLGKRSEARIGRLI